MDSEELGVAVAQTPNFAALAQEVEGYESADVDVISVSEAYGSDAISQLGYFAAITRRVKLATGIVPVHTRTPTLIAMTAVGLDHVSGGRAELGLGASGSQVIEGFHGVPFHAPLARLRDTVEICRSVWRRDSLQHAGRSVTVPVAPSSGGPARTPMRLLTAPRRTEIPITIAALTNRAVEQAAEIADAWLPLFLYPEKLASRWGSALASGKDKRDPNRSEMSIIAQVPLYIGPGYELARERHRRTLALYVGAMGPADSNFYTQLVASYGFAAEARTIQRLYLNRQREQAIDNVPKELVLMTSLIGPEDFVRDRIDKYRAAGVTRFMVQPAAESTRERIAHVQRFRELMRT